MGYQIMGHTVRGPAFGAQVTGPSSMTELEEPTCKVGGFGL